MDKHMNPRAALEAILFVAEAPVPLRELTQVLEMGTPEVKAMLVELADELESDQRGLVLREIAGGWRLYSKPGAFAYLERFATTQSATRMSGAALEVLAVIAYRQPVSRSQIAEIRGVDSDSVIRTLERRGMIEEAGRLSTPGNPAVYRTSQEFLEKLGLRGLEELPPLADHVPPAEIVETLEETFRVDQLRDLDDEEQASDGSVVEEA
jgi:segregation and condensation protein B